MSFVVGLLVLVGCGTSQTDAEAGDSTPVLNGEYRLSSSTQTDGAIASITFSAGHYSLRRDPCHGACDESGTFTLNAARDQLTLTNEATGVAASLPFRVSAAGSAPAPLRPMDDLVKAGTPLVKECAGLVTRGLRLVVAWGTGIDQDASYSGGDCPPPVTDFKTCAATCPTGNRCIRDPLSGDMSYGADQICVDSCDSACTSPQVCLPRGAQPGDTFKTGNYSCQSPQ